MSDIQWSDGSPIYRQLKDRVIAMMLDGIIKPGDALPSVRQVAAEYQLNPITVSRAINTPDKVAKKRLQAVLSAVEQLGYVPNVAAGSLHTRRSRLVAAIVPSIRTSMFAETVFDQLW